MDADWSAAGAPAWYIAGFFYALLAGAGPAVDPGTRRRMASNCCCGRSSSPGRPTSAPISPVALRQDGSSRPRSAPDKTVEGLYGGIAAATLLGGAWVLATGLGKPLLVLAPVLAVAAQAGDLFESGMKRRAGVKDSGHWLPGHGGVLDRLDGLVPVAVLTAAAQLMGLT